jgi:uncharacterized membrane protein HdeD (DUF308 family)
VHLVGFYSIYEWRCTEPWMWSSSLRLLLLMYICIFKSVNMMPLPNWYSALKLCFHGWCVWQMWLLTVHRRRSQVVISYCLHIRFYLANIQTCNYKSQSDKQTNNHWWFCSLMSHLLTVYGCIVIFHYIILYCILFFFLMLMYCELSLCDI